MNKADLVFHGVVGCFFFFNCMLLPFANE